MFISQTPLFAPGSILTAAMLEALRDYPRQLLQSWFAACSDGVLAGVAIGAVEHNRLQVGGGILKWHGCYYLLNEAVDLELERGKGARRIVVEFTGPKTLENFELLQGELKTLELADEEEEGRQQNSGGGGQVLPYLELGRYIKSDETANLSCTYKHFKDLENDKRLNLLNIKEVPIATRGEHLLLHPRLLQLFGTDLLEKIGLRGGTPLDYSFITHCLNMTVSGELLHEYLKISLGLATEELSQCGNRGLYRLLLRKLNEPLKVDDRQPAAGSSAAREQETAAGSAKRKTSIII